MSSRKLLTLDEIEQAFRSDPDSARAYMQERKDLRLREVAANLEDERELVRELTHAGMQVPSIDDLINTRQPHPKAIPVSLDTWKAPHRPDTWTASREGYCAERRSEWLGRP